VPGWARTYLSHTAHCATACAALSALRRCAASPAAAPCDFRRRLKLARLPALRHGDAPRLGLGEDARAASRQLRRQPSLSCVFKIQSTRQSLARRRHSSAKWTRLAFDSNFADLALVAARAGMLRGRRAQTRAPPQQDLFTGTQAAQSVAQASAQLWGVAHAAQSPRLTGAQRTSRGGGCQADAAAPPLAAARARRPARPLTQAPRGPTRSFASAIAPHARLCGGRWARPARGARPTSRQR